MNNTQWGTFIVEELIRLGVCHFCMAPGSRSTPIVSAIARHPKATSHIFIDERSAAFFALGIAKFNNIPAVMVTTSGSAITHAYPAIIEAEAHNIPLLLLSADRPPELRNSGANQTIDQTKLFGDHVAFFVDLPCPSPHFSIHNLLSLIDHAVARTKKGPVHINCMFRKPLVPEPVSIPNPWSDEGPYCHITPLETKTSWRIPTHKRAILIIGMLQNHRDQQHALSIARAAQCPVFCDASSGIRLSNIPNSLYPIDTVIQSDLKGSFLKPDIIIHIGGSLVSKQIPLWVESQTCPIVQISSVLTRTQIHAHTQIIASIPSDIGSLLHPLDCSTLHKNIHNIIEDKISDVWCEPSIVRHCTQSLPLHTSLFVSNSMPVRDLNRFSHTTKDWIRTGVNRGASGIDGIISTAAGWTSASGHPAVLIVGDLASIHDLGSFLQLSTRNIPLLICIINNGGGGIFSFLPISKEEDIFEEHFATAHTLSVAPITQAMGIPSTSVHTRSDFDLALSNFHAAPCFSVVELHTHRQENLRIHQELDQSIARTISSFVGPS